MTTLQEIENEVRILNSHYHMRMTTGIDIIDGRRVWFVKLEHNASAISHVHVETCLPSESKDFKAQLAAAALEMIKERYRESRGK